MSNNPGNPFEGLGDAGFPEELSDDERSRQEASIRQGRLEELRNTTLQATGRVNMPRRQRQIPGTPNLEGMFTPPLADPVRAPASVYQDNHPAAGPSGIQPYRIALQPFVPDFGIVDIDPENIGKILSTYCHRGSRIVGVDITSIDCTITELPPSGVLVNLQWLLEHGMRFFDAIIWLSAPAAQRPQLTAAPNKDSIPVLSHAELSKAIFYIYFFLLTQAKYPDQVASGQPVPSFLRVILGLTEPPVNYVRKVSSFNVALFDPTWIKYVNFRGFGQETLSRFGLGVAGYRMFAPFKLLTPINPLPENARNAYLFARRIATSAPTWAVHPVTRNPALLSERGNLNKNLSNLMLICFTQQDLTSLVTNRQLFSPPTRQIGYDNWLSWQADPGMALSDPIFPA